MKEHILKLTSPIPPSTNHYLAYRAVVKHGKPIGMSYCTKEAKEYKESFAKYVKEEAIKQRWGLTPNPYQHFYVDAIFYFQRFDQDSSNYYKCLLDSITDSQVIWIDDNVACERTQGVYYDSSNPRIELTIHPVDYIGIFDNQDALDSFEQKCKSCTRYCRNCSILNKAKEGRIQEEIADGMCAKYKDIKYYGKNK